jgi:hypothetical protein
MRILELLQGRLAGLFEQGLEIARVTRDRMRRQAAFDFEMLEIGGDQVVPRRARGFIADGFSRHYGQLTKTCMAPGVPIR